MQLLSVISVLIGIALVRGETVVNCVDFEASDLTSIVNSFSEAEKLNITSLNCDNSGLTGEFPAVIAELVNLEELSLANNEIEGELPLSFSSLFNLTTINLDNNCLTGDIVSLVSEMSLIELTLDRNKFEGTLEELPISLIEFSASFNDFDGGIPLSIEELSGLEVFRVNGNRLSGSFPDVFSELPITELFITNNDIEGVVPNHTAIVTDAEVGDSVKKANLDQKWRKYTLDDKCPNRFSYAIDKMFTESIVFTIPILIGGICLFFTIVIAIFYLCLGRAKGKIRKSVTSTVYEKDHYKIEVYVCEAAEPTDEAKLLTRRLRSKLKAKRARVSSYKTMNEGMMADAAAVLILFTQAYFEEMANEETRAFKEVFTANEAGQWILFACLEKKLHTLGKSTDFLEGDYHLYDMSSIEAIEANFDELMNNLYQAQAEKEMLLNQHT